MKYTLYSDVTTSVPTLVDSFENFIHMLHMTYTIFRIYQYVTYTITYMSFYNSNISRIFTTSAKRWWTIRVVKMCSPGTIGTRRNFPDISVLLWADQLTSAYIK